MDVSATFVARTIRRFEDCGATSEERQDFGVGVVAPGQHVGAVADFAFAGQENEDAAAFADVEQVLHAARDGFRQFLVLKRLQVDVLDRVDASADLDDRGVAEERRDAGGVERGGRDDDAEFGAPREQELHVPEQKVDVEGAFVHLVQDDAVVLVQFRVVLRLGQQDTVRHELDDRGIVRAVVEAHLIADLVSARASGLVRETAGERGGGDPARLGAADASGASEALQQGGLRELGRFAGPGGAADDDDLMRLQRGADFRDLRGDREIVRELAADAGSDGDERTFLRSLKQTEKLFAFLLGRNGIAVQQIKERAAAFAQAGAVGQTQGGPDARDFPPDLARVAAHRYSPAPGDWMKFTSTSARR